MTRRGLLLLLGGAATAARALRAQQKAMPVIGYLHFASPGSQSSFLAAFWQGLRETGYVEGENVAVEYRWAEGNYDRLPALATDLVGRNVDVPGPRPQDVRVREDRKQLERCSHLTLDHVEPAPLAVRDIRIDPGPHNQLAFVRLADIDVDSVGHDHRRVNRLEQFGDKRLERVLRYMLDESELLSAHGIRSLSRAHRERPFVLTVDGQEYGVHYTPAESDSGLFGGNSNWRGPVWFPLNYLLAEALERYHHFYGDDLRVECPTGSGRLMNLREVAQELYRRLAGLFVPDADGRRPSQGLDPRFRDDPHWRDLVTFAEFFCGDTGRGIGARYQGWTTLAIRCFEDLARSRSK